MTLKLKGQSVQFLPGCGGEGPRQFHCCTATAAASLGRDTLHWDSTTGAGSLSGAQALPGATELIPYSSFLLFPVCGGGKVKL